MAKNCEKYPKIWELKRPDSNIDHRRLPNLQVFFKRFGISYQVTEIAADYKPSDLVTWTIGGKMPHIGTVTSKKAAMESETLSYIMSRQDKFWKTTFFCTGLRAITGIASDVNKCDGFPVINLNLCKIPLPF